MKKIIKKILPPIILDLFKPQQKYGFFGQYKDWSEASKNSKGYDGPEILEKVKNALLRVKNGEAAYERDSIIFKEKQGNWLLLASLLQVASGNRLSILDFGGSLGSSYFQNRDFIKHLSITWNIVEQENFVDCGKKHFEDNNLKFYKNINEVLQNNSVDVVLFGSSLQYLEKPFEILKSIINSGIKNIIIERTPFSSKLEDDTLTVQKVPPKIYDASYPAWIFSKEKMRKFFEKEGFNILVEEKTGEMPNFGLNTNVDLLFFLIRKK
jgi:putative methyltransferase (TIGR04325 family)